jgi:DnaA regulatory inactivator Hda
VAWLDKWPEWPSHCSVVHGPSGSGKTHLAHVWQNRSKAHSLSRSTLLAQDATSLGTENKILLFDDADKIAGNASGEEALFHLYNHLREVGGFLLLTAQHAPAQWGVKLPDLRSRLSSIPSLALAAPDDDLLMGLLLKQFRDRQIDISMDVVTYLLPRMPRTPEAIRTLVTALDRASLAEGRGISIALARRFIEEQS